ncbi:MAG TPA: VWA domain-containing protein [Planctomycetes bacterium]|nr:VWA domain-containing protein [Fuerstiella sp.]HIK93679.1 VWA domain-containing protein [Planctomycetota bacterium]
MSFSTPAAFLWALLAVPLVIFYILKIRMRRIPVSTVMFWEQVFDEKQPRSIWQQLRHLLSLLLQLLFLMLLVSAVTDPFLENDIRQQRQFVVVVDTSASMQALSESGDTRLASAKSQIEQMIQSLKLRDEMALIVAGGRPRVVCGLTSHQRTLQNRLAEITPTDGPTGVIDAVEIGRRLLGSRKNGQVVVVTDGCFGAAAELAASDQIVWSNVGTSSSNVGITRYQVRRSLLDPIAYQILIEVGNFSDGAIECGLDLSLNGDLLDVIPLKLAAGEIWTDVIEKTSVAGGVISADVQWEDDLAADNTASSILPARRKIPVTLVTDGNWFLQRVLEANDVVDLTLVSEVPQHLPPDGVLVLHRNTPQQLPAGNVFVVQPIAATKLWEVAGAISQPLVDKQDTSSDLMRHIRLDNVLMPEALKLIPKVDYTTLVESISGDPLYLQIPHANGNVLVLPVNLDQGDLPLRTAFPIMLTNALAWFAGGNGELIEAMAAGDTRILSVPPHLQKAAEQHDGQLKLTAPDDSHQNIRVTDGHCMIGPLDQAGIWNLSEPVGDDQAAAVDSTAAHTPSLQIACNLTDLSESDLRVPETIEPRRQILNAGFGGRPIWFYLVIAAFLLTMIEWLLFQRRWIS